MTFPLDKPISSISYIPGESSCTNADVTRWSDDPKAQKNQNMQSERGSTAQHIALHKRRSSDNFLGGAVVNFGQSESG